MSLRFFYLRKLLTPLPCHVVKCARPWLSSLSCASALFSTRAARNGPDGRHLLHVGRDRWRGISAVATPIDLADIPEETNSASISLSLTACPGCGALAQVVEPGEAGYYSTKRKVVTSFVRWRASDEEHATSRNQDEVAVKALRQADPKLVHSLGLDISKWDSPDTSKPLETPLCDRCHHLIHHHLGVPIAHPSLDSIQDTIAESPYKYNHIYHVIDAADFPLSLVSNIYSFLSISAQRSKNRRAKHVRYRHGKITEMSFIITRSDLLAPKKEQVDTMMPYLVQVLRDALGSAGRDVRLGNVRCVSAKRGWWTKELKAEIWDRGGGGWMVGKVNVGKSNLFEMVFPKGRSEDINFDAVRRRARLPHHQSDVDVADDARVFELLNNHAQDLDNYMLPPARAETPYPTMPTISSLPGTTASPIRIPFGNGKGELIDLPGLARGNLDTFVREEDREGLVMKSRITPEQFVIKPGQSLLLGGLIRITPLVPDTVILAYPFTPLRPHLTGTDKAIAIQTGVPMTSGVRGLIVEDAAKEAMASAGTFHLKWDATKQRAGPLTSASAAGLKPHVLPFQVLSADILVEGVGWVELVAQVRRKRLEHKYTKAAAHDLEADADHKRQSAPAGPAHFPAVEVFSPQGRFVGVRQPMNAWVLGGANSKPGRAENRGRPRRSMASLKGSRKGQAAQTASTE